MSNTCGKIRFWLVSLFSLIPAVLFLSAELYAFQPVEHAAAQKQISLLFLILIAAAIVILTLILTYYLRRKSH